MSKLTKQQIEELNQLATLEDETIDTSDIPEQLDWSEAVRGRFYQTTAETVQLDSDVLTWFKSKGGQHYQQMINQTLRDFIQHSR